MKKNKQYDFQINKNDAFTLVELLIVIVVISILAAISVVAYNGFQQRAQASKAASSMRLVENALRMYWAEHGTMPDEGCIGHADSYPASPPFAAGECSIEHLPDGSTYSWGNHSTTLNSQLANYGIGQDFDSEIPITREIWGENYYYLNRGIAFHHNSSTRGQIGYAVKGEHSCPSGTDSRRFYLNGITYCNKVVNFR